MSVRRRTGCCLSACALAWVVTSGCGSGGSTPAGPSSATPAAASWTLRGSVTETLTRAPVEGATVTFNLSGGAREATTGAGGVFELTGAGTQGNLEAVVSAPGYITRQVHLQAPSLSRAIALDLIRDSAPFALTYYRQLVRDGFDDPDDLKPLRRWTVNPNFYIRTHNPQTNGALPASQVDTLVAIVRAAVPQMTGGQLQAGQIETGAEDRSERPGEIKVSFVHDPDAEFCGRATVGGNPGVVTLNYGVSGCGSSCGPVAPRTIAHEIGHALGFYHVAQGAVLNTVWYDRDCGTTEFSDAERFHARVAYSRPRGNVDLDVDPASALMLQAPEAPPKVVSCR